MRPKLKPPGTKCLKLKCDILLSTSAFKINSRCYNTASTSAAVALAAGLGAADGSPAPSAAAVAAGAYTRPHFSST